MLKALRLVLLVLCKTEVALWVEKIRHSISAERKPEWFHTWLWHHLYNFSVRNDVFPFISIYCLYVFVIQRLRKYVLIFVLKERHLIYCIRTYKLCRFLEQVRLREPYLKAILFPKLHAIKPYHARQHQRLKEIHASGESWKAELSFESPAVAFYKLIKTTLNTD